MIKNSVNCQLILTLLLLQLCCLPSMLAPAQTQPPRFPSAAYNIVSLGAIPDGQTDAKPILDKAIALCSTSGGGHVIIPKGTFFVAGPIILKSHVNLHFETGATIIFSSNENNYLPAVLTMWEGTELFNYSPLIYAYQCSDIAITGPGKINGSASKGFATWRPQRSPEQDRLRQMGIDGTPVYQRVFGKGYHLPPDMIQLFGCKNVLIQHCHFTVGDDGIAIKAGRDQDGWRIGQPTENVTIRDCFFISKTNGLCIGSEMSAGARNVYMYRDTIKRCLSAVYFKSNLDRGGFIEHIRVNDIQCDSARSAVIRFENNYHGSRGGRHPTRFYDFVIQNITCRSSGEVGIYAVGVKDHPLTDILLKDVIVKHTPRSQIIDYVEKLRYEDIRINDSTFKQPVITGPVMLYTD